MRMDEDIDAIILGCTHYPLLMSSIVKNLPDGVRGVATGTICGKQSAGLSAATSEDGMSE